MSTCSPDGPPPPPHFETHHLGSWRPEARARLLDRLQREAVSYSLDATGLELTVPTACSDLTAAAISQCVDVPADPGRDGSSSDSKRASG